MTRAAGLVAVLGAAALPFATPSGRAGEHCCQRQRRGRADYSCCVLSCTVVRAIPIFRYKLLVLLKHLGHGATRTFAIPPGDRLGDIYVPLAIHRLILCFDTQSS